MTTEAQERYYDRIRGVSKGPNSLETRAAKSAGHRAKNTREWGLHYEHALAVLQMEQTLSEQLKGLRASVTTKRSWK